MKKLFQAPEVDVVSFGTEEVLSLSAILEPDETPVYPSGIKTN